jgi:hypothetical protein
MKQPKVNQPRVSQPGEKDLQGEGNYDATRRYDKAAKEFAESGQVDDAARAAQPASAEEAEELRRAEREGQSRSKGEDPGQPSTPTDLGGAPHRRGR